VLRRLEQSEGNVIGYSLAGDVSDDEYTQLVSELRDAITRHGSIRVLFRLSELTASSFFSALDERTQFAKEHREDIERIAIVTDETAATALGKVAEGIHPVDVRTFSTEEEPEAWLWLE
jgi:hypothetical protein